MCTSDASCLCAQSKSAQSKSASDVRYTSWRHAFSRILAEEGPSALLSGWKPRVAWISVGGAVFIGSFEEMRRQVQVRPELQ